MPDTFTVQQLAERWQSRQHTVLAAINSGRLQAFKLNPAAKRPTWRIPRSAVERYEAGESQVTKPKRRQRSKRNRKPGFVEYY